MKRVALAVVVCSLGIVSPWLLVAFVYPWMRSVSPDAETIGAFMTCVLIAIAMFYGGAFSIFWAKDGLERSATPPVSERPHGTPPPPPKD